jgi:TRAP-type C4-dicarboxylate transport system permease small subunit
MSAVNSFLGEVATEIINPVIYLLAAVAFAYFVWGGVKFVANSADEAKKSDGKRAMLWGIIGLVVIFGAYGIMNFALSVFNLPAIGG